MGYGVLHCVKVKTGAIGGIASHHTRAHESKTNLDIDQTRTAQNYVLVTTDKIQQRLNARLKELQATTKTGKARKMRSDAVAAYDFVVSASPEEMAKMSPERQKQYFKNATNLFKSRYGEKNVITAVVHMDEKTPHLHLLLVPEKDGRVSAKALFNKQEMRDLQDNFYKQVSSQFELERGKVGSKVKHIETLDFKLKTAKTELEAIRKTMTELENLPPVVRQRIDAEIEKSKKSFPQFADDVNKFCVSLFLKNKYNLTKTAKQVHDFVHAIGAKNSKNHVAACVAAAQEQLVTQKSESGYTGVYQKNNWKDIAPCTTDFHEPYKTSVGKQMDPARADALQENWALMSDFEKDAKLAEAIKCMV
jgi:ribosomal silencing factor RsfS